MRMLIDDGGARRPVAELSYMQSRQAAAIMDCVGRLIPQEGVDYDVDIIFRGEANENLSMNITPHTDKGEWWRRYVSEMMKKYPPRVENPEMSIPEEDSSPTEPEVVDAEVVS